MRDGSLKYLLSTKGGQPSKVAVMRYKKRTYLSTDKSRLGKFFFQFVYFFPTGTNSTSNSTAFPPICMPTAFKSVTSNSTVNGLKPPSKL